MGKFLWTVVILYNDVSLSIIGEFRSILLQACLILIIMPLLHQKWHFLCINNIPIFYIPEPGVCCIEVLF